MSSEPSSPSQGRVPSVGRLWRKAKRVTDQMRVRDSITYGNLAVLNQRYGPAPGLSGFELKVFSQNGEDGVLAEIFHRIGIGPGFFVEFGIGPGREGNAVLLADVYRWRGLFIEGGRPDYEQLEYKYLGIDEIRTEHSMVTAENIETILEKAGVPAAFELLSIDIDSNDYWVWQAISAYRPLVVVCEFNGGLDPRIPLTQAYAPASGWDKTVHFGASLAALAELGRHKGYVLVHTDLTGTNAFFVATQYAELFEDCMPVASRRAVPGFSDFRHRADPAGRPFQVPDPNVPPLGPQEGPAWP